MHEPSPLLSLPSDRRDRWSLLDSLVTRWHKRRDGAGCSQDELRDSEHSRGFPIPAALTEWYTRFGNRADIWSLQDDFLAPDKLYFENDALIFYVENQGVVRWGIPPHALDADDPPVVVESVDTNDLWIPQTDNISAFAIYMFAYTLAFVDHNRYVYGFAKPGLAETIRANFPSLEFPDNWWTETRILGYDDLIIAIDCTDHVHACALSEESLATFTSLTTANTFEILASSDNSSGT